MTNFKTISNDEVIELISGGGRKKKPYPGHKKPVTKTKKKHKIHTTQKKTDQENELRLQTTQTRTLENNDNDKQITIKPQIDPRSEQYRLLHRKRTANGEPAYTRSVNFQGENINSLYDEFITSQDNILDALSNIYEYFEENGTVMCDRFQEVYIQGYNNNQTKRTLTSINKQVEKLDIEQDINIFFITFYNLLVYAEEFITEDYESNYIKYRYFTFIPSQYRDINRFIIQNHMERIIESIRNMFIYESQYHLFNGTYIPPLEEHPIDILDGIYVYLKSLRKLIIRLYNMNGIFENETLLNINNIFREYSLIINKIKGQEEINNAQIVIRFPNNY